MQGRHIVSGLAIALAATGAGAFEGDAQAAEAHVSMCAGCHGIPGYRTAFPEVYPVPRLGGQHPEYLARALRAYRDGTRTHPSMRAIAEGLSDQQIVDLAAYYGRPREEAK